MTKNILQINSFDSYLEEITWIAGKIKHSIKQGKPAGEIAIIARKHSNLQSTAKIFHALDIPICYELKENVLEKIHIKQIITILKFINSINQVEETEKQNLLPQILSYGFWEISSIEIYEISIKAYKERQRWLEVMLAYDQNSKVYKVASFLLDLAKDKVDSTAQQILDKILGVSTLGKIPNDEMEDYIDSVSNESESEDTFISKYKWHYFDRHYEKNQFEYLTFLSSLKVFFSAIREFRAKQILMIQDVIDFVELMEANKLPLVDSSSFNQQKEAVNLLTAHKSKGLEFGTVFVINCQKKEWQSKGMANKISMPANLPIFPEGDNTDDNIRLFYVAITRSKSELYLSYHNFDDSGNELEKISFLPTEKYTINEIDLPEKTEPLQIWLTSNVQNNNLSLEEKSFLKPILETYKLSVTHLNNFINVTQNGPRKFLEQNLLLFPQSKSPDASYGSAMHLALARFYYNFRETKNLPQLGYLLDVFKDSLKNERLSSKDFSNYLSKGKMSLTRYFEEKKQSFNPNHYIEYDFRYQGVEINGAELTGKIDKLCVDDSSNVLVVDLKTGKSYDKWQVYTPEEKIKLDRYRRQLVFYKLLVENSREFSKKYTVNQGSLEFLEVNTNQKIISLTADIEQEETQRLIKLVQVVYKKIMNLEFPDVSQYSKDLNGINHFIDDLISES